MAIHQVFKECAPTGGTCEGRMSSLQHAANTPEKGAHSPRLAHADRSFRAFEFSDTIEEAGNVLHTGPSGGGQTEQT